MFSYSMTKEEREAYEKRRADELYENMLKSNEVAKMRAADVAMEVLVKCSYCCYKIFMHAHRDNGVNRKRKLKKLK